MGPRNLASGILRRITFTVSLTRCTAGSTSHFINRENFYNNKERSLYATLTPRSKKKIHMIPKFYHNTSLCEVIYIYIGLCQLRIAIHTHTHTPTHTHTQTHTHIYKYIYLFIYLLIYRWS